MSFINSLVGGNVDPGDITAGLNPNMNLTQLDPDDLAKQNAFVAQLQQQIAGNGPSVAGQMLQNQSANNNAAALAAASSQRGVNPGMALRNAQQQNSVSNQQSNQTAAAARAQEQLNATGQLGNQLNNMQQQSVGVKENNQQQQNNMNLAKAGINGSLETQNASNNSAVAGGIFSAAGSALSKLAQGGVVVPHVLLADGGEINPLPASSSGSGGPSSNAAQWLSQLKPVDPTGSNALVKGLSSATGSPSGASSSKSPATSLAGGPMDQMGAAGGLDSVAMIAAHGGKVPALVSPGERYLPPREVKEVAAGKKNPMKAGEKIPGKPKVGGAKDSYANDTVPKTLESGGIVLPRHITQGKDAPEKAAAFVRAIIARSGLK